MRDRGKACRVRQRIGHARHLVKPRLELDECRRRLRRLRQHRDARHVAEGVVAEGRLPAQTIGDLRREACRSYVVVRSSGVPNASVSTTV